MSIFYNFNSCYAVAMALTRKKHAMPSAIKRALVQQKLLQAYNQRPAYQRNDYLGWIQSAKQEATKQKRLTQMLHELRVGGVYMRMKHPPSKK